MKEIAGKGVPLLGEEGNTLSWQFIHTFIDRRYSEGVHMKNTIRRVFGCLAALGITLAFASLGAAGAAESATVLVTDSATGVKHLPGFTVDVIATGLPEVGDLTIGETDCRCIAGAQANRFPQASRRQKADQRRGCHCP